MLELFKSDKRIYEIIKPILKTYQEDKLNGNGNHYISVRLRENYESTNN